MPPAPIDPQALLAAVRLAQAGDWDGAHAFAQRHEDDPDACWLHACLHKIEGDAANARYWYGQASRAFEDWPDPTAELAAIAAHEVSLASRRG